MHGIMLAFHVYLHTILYAHRNVSILEECLLSEQSQVRLEQCVSLHYFQCFQAKENYTLSNALYRITFFKRAKRRTVLEDASKCQNANSSNKTSR